MLLFYLGFPRWHTGPPANTGDAGSIPGLGRSPGGGHGNPLQCSSLENPMDRAAWWAPVHGVAKSRPATAERLSAPAHLFCAGSHVESCCIQLSGLAYFWRATASWTFLVSNDLDISEEYWGGLFFKCASIGTVFVFFLMLDLGYRFGGGSPQVKGPSHHVVWR